MYAMGLLVVPLMSPRYLPTLEYHLDTCLHVLNVNPCQVDQQVNVLFTFSIQLDVIHVEKVADGSCTLELVSISSPTWLRGSG